MSIIACCREIVGASKTTVAALSRPKTTLRLLRETDLKAKGGLFTGWLG